MSTTCNLIQQVKVSDLVRYSTLTSKDLILTIESGSSNDLYSRKSTFGDVVTFLSSVTGSYTGSFSGSAKTWVEAGLEPGIRRRAAKDAS